MRQIDRQTDRQTVLTLLTPYTRFSADWWTISDNQMDRETDRQPDRQTGRHISRPYLTNTFYKIISRPMDKMTDR